MAERSTVGRSATTRNLPARNLPTRNEISSLGDEGNSNNRSQPTLRALGLNGTSVFSEIDASQPSAPEQVTPSESTAGSSSPSYDTREAGENGSYPFVNTDMDHIANIAGYRGAFRLHALDAQNYYPDAIRIQYQIANGSGLGLTNTGGSEINVSTSPKAGFIGLTAYAGPSYNSLNLQDPGPIPAGNTGDPLAEQLLIPQSSGATDGTVKFYFVD